MVSELESAGSLRHRRELTPLRPASVHPHTRSLTRSPSLAHPLWNSSRTHELTNSRTHEQHELTNSRTHELTNSRTHELAHELSHARTQKTNKQTEPVFELERSAVRSLHRSLLPNACSPGSCLLFAHLFPGNLLFAPARHGFKRVTC